MSLPAEFLKPVAYDSLAGFDDDNLDDALSAFRRSAERLIASLPAQRPARPPPASLIRVARAAMSHDMTGAAFFRHWFRPFRMSQQGFVTAYYEPELDARLSPEPGYETPVLARPPDLATLNETPLTLPSGERLTAARRGADGALTPYPDRRAIETLGAAKGAEPIAYLRDPLDAFVLHVQGSGALRLADGATLALTYDGRNGWPYTSIGKLLIDRGYASASDMTMECLAAILRGLGLERDAPGRLLMQQNRSYVFFRLDNSPERLQGPIGGAGCALTPLRSIAIDRALWCYGLPYLIATRAPWENESETRLERLMIGQDTGSAIVGPARADLFFGSGTKAGRLAGRVRHAAELTVLLPADEFK